MSPLHWSLSFTALVPGMTVSLQASIDGIGHIIVIAVSTSLYSAEAYIITIILCRKFCQIPQAVCKVTQSMKSHGCTNYWTLSP